MWVRVGVVWRAGEDEEARGEWISTDLPLVGRVLQRLGT